MRYLLLFCFIFLTEALFACRCGFLGELSKTDIDKTDYIALVRIKEILPVKVDSPKYYDANSYFKIVVEEISHYKGTHFTEIIIAGGHPKFNTWTSCDFGMNEQEEWIIFAQYDKNKPFVYPCWRTAQYRQADGFRDWQYQSGLKDVSFLDTFFDKKSKTITKRNGEVKHYFSNGNVEKIEHYKKGKLHGQIEYFFPDGKLYGKGFYYKGLLHKTSNWYYKDGAIEKRTTYNKGLKVDTSIYYIKTANGYHPFFVSVYNKKGDIILFQEYGGDWKKRYLWTETEYEPNVNKEKITFYFESGKVRSVQYRLNRKDFGDYIEFDEQGKIVRQWKYDENGKVIK
jgi:antitoxin component YwqK of YwqJK toxin-antitoxin module